MAFLYRIDATFTSCQFVNTPMFSQCYAHNIHHKHLLSDAVATPLWPSVGVKPNTCKVGDLESSETPECSELDNKGQNTLHWGVLGVIGKVSKRRYRKWPRIGNSDILAQVMGKRRAGSQTGNLTPDH
jgi:hypothetical protein